MEPVKLYQTWGVRKDKGRGYSVVLRSNHTGDVKEVVATELPYIAACAKADKLQKHITKHNECFDSHQPYWKYVTNLGDVNWLDYGGKFLFVDLTGRYEPELEILQSLEELSESDKKTHSIWRVSLEKCYLTKGVLSDNKFHKGKPAWFAEKAQEMGQDETGLDKDLDELFCSDDPTQRALAYLTMIGWYGVHEFDQYPVEYTKKQVLQRYRKWGLK